MTRGNVLLVTVDQLTARALRGPLASHAATPNFGRLTARGTDFTSHFTVTVPCGPSRASLLTGLYAMNHRAVRNGTPLARHHATVATEARKAGYEPLLFGYTDIVPDPATLDPEDPDLTIYEGVAPGFRELVEMRQDLGYEWPAYLRAQGYEFAFDPVNGVQEQFRPLTAPGTDPGVRDPALYAAEHSETTYLTDRTLAALDIRRNQPWFAHVAYIRPHPPLVAPAPYNKMVDPDDLPAPQLEPPDHPFLKAWFSEPSKPGMYWGFDGDCSTLDEATIRACQAVYLGMLAEVDHHLGRLIDWLDATGQTERTLVVLTADHGDMLGDKRMWGKDSVFDPAFHVPLIVCDPRRETPGSQVAAMTESVDLMPTILDWIGLPTPEACDGSSLLPLIEGGVPTNWRDAVFFEADFALPGRPTRFERTLGLGPDQAGVSILREARWKYVHFGGGVPPMLFDLDVDPGETCNLAASPAHSGEISRLAQKMIDRMTERRDRRLTHLSFGV